MEFARNVLICRAYFLHQNPIRFAFLRSDLSCHHIFIYLRNLSMCTAKSQLLLYAASLRCFSTLLLYAASLRCFSTLLLYAASLRCFSTLLLYAAFSRTWSL
jgi:hypothetical protein